MRSPWVCSRAHDSAVLGLGAAARPDAACRSDDGAGLHLRPPRTSARGRVLAMRRDHRRCGHRAGADGDSVSGRVSLVLADASRGAPHAGAGLPEASAVVLGSGTMATRYAPIGEYGVSGDLYTVALVGMDGSIDFLCLPHFDSPSVFAALVDAERGGRFQIAPLLEGAARKQLYLPDTNVLLTRFLDAHGVAELSDFMPVEDAGLAHNLVRRAEEVGGGGGLPKRRAPRFDHARATPPAPARS